MRDYIETHCVAGGGGVWKNLIRTFPINFISKNSGENLKSQWSAFQNPGLQLKYK